ncbi:hypothetical protein DFH09DRAFT_1354778 [Mycena vulgaris]|nr:hypothetical protein DFH09DRAFT_1354778 [Mycena vulgaris]
MKHCPPIHADLRRLTRLLNGEVDAWLADDNGIVIPHGPATLIVNQLSASFQIPAETKFCVGWRSHLDRPITALCALIRPPLPGETENCRATVHVMDDSRPETQLQPSQTLAFGPRGGWFLSPPAFETGFVQLEICRAIRKPTGISLTDPQAGDLPALILSPSPESGIARRVIPQMYKREREDNCRWVRPQTGPYGTADKGVFNEVSVMDLLMVATMEIRGPDAEFRKEYWM